MYSLVIDCSHKENFIGLFKDTDNWIFQRKFNGQPFEDLVENLKSTLSEASIDKAEISRFYTPHSPGSTLGIRVTQMMIQGLLKTCCISAKLTQYNGLYLSALLLLEKEKEKGTNDYLLTENGRHSWNVLKIDQNLKTKPEIQKYGLEELTKLHGRFFYIPQMKTWSTPIVEVKEINYSPNQFLNVIELLDNPEVDTSHLFPESNTYVKWNRNKLLK